MTLYQIILAILAVVFLFNNLYKFVQREHAQTFFKLLVSTIIWGGILTLSLFPEVSHHISLSLGLGENLNTLIFLGFVTVFAMFYRLLFTIERLERDISEIVRKEALKNLSKDHDLPHM